MVFQSTKPITDCAVLQGVKPSPGGVHQGLGTHNALAALGNGAYLEILARDPAQPDPPKTWMAIDTVTTPSLLLWASKRDDLAATVASARLKGYDPGDVQEFSRADPASGRCLSWQLSYKHYAQPLPGGGIVPFLISWDPSCASFLPPATAAGGCILRALRAESPEPVEVSAMLEAVGTPAAGLSLTHGQRPRLVATLDTPHGIVELA